MWDKSAGNFDSEESIFAQYMTEVVFPRALSVCSGFHAGPGQLALGRSKWRADLCVLDQETKTTRRLSFFNYHGFFHYDESCKREGHERSCRQWTGTDLTFNETTFVQDRLMLDYADAMSKVSPGLIFEYRTFSPCFLFHGNKLPIFVPEKREFAEMGGSEGTRTPQDHLERTSPLRFIPGRKYKVGVTQDALLDDIFSGKTKGFVTISGGKETSMDFARLSFGFCHTRGKQTSTELGSEAVRLCAERCGNDPVKGSALLEQKVGEDVTFGRLHYSGVHTISTDFFTFLVKKRRLSNYKILHFLHYEFRHFLSPWVISMLQDRWEIKKGLSSSKKCSELVVKIILNAIYGYRWVVFRATGHRMTFSF